MIPIQPVRDRRTDGTSGYPANLEPDERLPAIMTTTRYWRPHEMGPTYHLMVDLVEEHVPNVHMADQWNDAGHVSLGGTG